MEDRLFKTATFLLGSVVGFAVMGATVYLAYSFAMAGFQYGLGLGATLVEEREARHVEITLANPTSLDELSRILYEQDVISNQLLFQIENVLQGNTADFQPGTFLVSTDMNAVRLTGAMRASAFFTDHRMTILEGFTNVDIASSLEQAEIMYADDFLEWLEEAEEMLENQFLFLRDIPERPNRIQGYLFPDTYMLPAVATPYDMVLRQLRRFEEIFDFEKIQRAAELGLSMDEVIIIASIVEREARISTDPMERSKFAAVIHNRLREGMMLEMPSTVAYALDRPVNSLVPSDFNVPSPLNTFVNYGLPQGAISNPGLASINAVLDPYGANYLYVLLIDQDTGTHFFTSSIEEYNQMRAEIEG